jgi:hypothetical protein
MAPKRKSNNGVIIKAQKTNVSKCKERKTTRNILQSQRSFISTTTRERRVTDTNGQTVSDIFTYSQEEQVTEAEIKEVVDEFSRSKIVPAFLGLTSSANSSIIKMFQNRFDMAFAQNKLIIYRPGMLDFTSHLLLLPDYSRPSSVLQLKCAKLQKNNHTMSKIKLEKVESLSSTKSSDPVMSTPAGPGFYLVGSERDLKLNYPIFRGLNTFEEDFKMHNHITYAQSSDVVHPGFLCLPIKFSDLVCFYHRHIITFSRFDILWQKAFFQPLTVDELLRMTLCRYTARTRNIAMPLVDKEEFDQPYPIISIDVDITKESHTDSDPHTNQRFGSTQRIISDLKSIPLSGIHSSLSSMEEEEQKEYENIDNEEKLTTKKSQEAWSDTEFEITVIYHLPDDVKMFKLNQSFAVKYAKVKASQRAGFDITQDVELLKKYMKTTDLESCLYEPIPSQGMVLASLLLDLSAIGAIKKYIHWCKQKREKKISDSLLSFQSDGSEIRECITKLEYGLTEARKQRSLLLQQEDEFPDKAKFNTPSYMLEYHGFIDPSKK